MSAIEPITGRYLHVELDGRDYRTYFEENGGGAPLVCLHTAGADSMEYRHLLNDPEITSRYRVIAFDMPYHGRSLPPDGWWAEEYKLTRQFYVEFIKAFCERLDLDQPLLMGCSMGGYVVFDAAIDYPEDFRAFISLQGRAYEPSWMDLADAVNHPEINANVMIRPVVASLVPGSATKALGQEIEWIYMRGAPGVLAGDFNYAGIEHDVRRHGEQLSRAGSKIFLIAGDWDWSCTQEHSDELESLIDGLTVVRSPDLGHFPMSENPAAFREALDPVLAAIESS